LIAGLDRPVGPDAPFSSDGIRQETAADSYTKQRPELVVRGLMTASWGLPSARDAKARGRNPKQDKAFAYFSAIDDGMWWLLTSYTP